MTTTPSPEALALKPCTCVEVHGEDPDCPHHGEETAWAIDNTLPHDWQQRVMDLRAERDALSAQLADTRPTSSGEVVLIEVERNDEGEVLICTGCGTVETIRSIRGRSATAFCCCPERKMVRAADFGDHRLASSGAGEPIAYRYDHPFESYLEPFGEQPLTEHDKEAGWTETPLYALATPPHLPPAEPVGDEALVERVARDMREAYGLYEGDVIVPWDRARPELKEAWFCCARAAIQAIPAPATDAGQSADGLVEAAKSTVRWLEAIDRCDMGEIVADGGITAGMVVQQEARTQASRLRASLLKSPSAGEEA